MNVLVHDAMYTVLWKYVNLFMCTLSALGVQFFNEDFTIPKYIFENKYIAISNGMQECCMYGVRDRKDPFAHKSFMFNTNALT